MSDISEETYIPPEDNNDETTGIPEDLRVPRRRKYTMSEAALEQRRQAAQQPKPGMQGVRNNYKHGLYAKDFANRLKPCKSSCPNYPCSMVNDGMTAPGGDCLDKSELMQFFRAVHSAISTKSTDDFNGYSALLIANSMKILQDMQESILQDGTILKREKMTKQGLQIEYVMHPALQALPKLIADLGMHPNEFMITPKAIAKQDGEEEGIKTLADLMSGVARKMKPSEGQG
jgi:hypothetical protein